ncbi:MAG: hypothetical protein AAFV43_13690 [Planctomycetota bacterium]
MTLRAPDIRADTTRGRLHALLKPTRGRDERRRAERAVFPFRLRVAEAATGRRDAFEPLPGMQFVIGRDLSESGLGFRHEIALPYRRVVLAAADERLDDLDLGDLRLEMLVRWCRFRGDGAYDSGGKIVRSSLVF